MTISKHSQFLAVMALSGCLFMFPAIVSRQANMVAISQENRVPSVYLGNWSGQASQNNNTAWSISVSIVPGSVGSVVGKIDYPSLNCGRELTLQQVNKGSIALLENLTYGAGTCVDRGTNVLKLSSAKKLDFQWFSPKGELEATGILRKASPDRR
jgi:hypothetical protein